MTPATSILERCSTPLTPSLRVQADASAQLSDITRFDVRSSVDCGTGSDVRI